MGRTSPHLLTSTDPQLAQPAGGSDKVSGHLPGTPVSVVTQGESLDSRIAVESRAAASLGRAGRASAASCTQGRGAGGC